jgi:hypothetical protein
MRLWLQLPLTAADITFDEARGRTTDVHFGGAAFAVDFRDVFTAEAGLAAELSGVGGEPTVAFGPHAWLRAGVTPALSHPAPGESGWLVQLVALAGYRYLERSAIVYEDYGLATERVDAVAFDAGAQATHVAASGFGLSVRLLAGVIVPFARSVSTETTLMGDYPPPRLRFAIPVAIDLGCRF